MSRGGRDLLWANDPTQTSNLDGIWRLNEVNNHIARNEWPTIPDAVSDLYIAEGDGNLTLSWTAPTTNGLPISLYSIEYTRSGGSTIVITISNTSYQITGLTNNTEYSIRVGAIVGDRVNYSTITTATPKAAAASLTLTDTASGANDCNERVDIGSYPAGTDNFVLVVTGSVEGNSTSTLNYTVTSIDSNVLSQTGTGAPAGLNVVVSYYGASSPKYLLIRGQFDRATSNVTVSVTARDSSNTEIASASITSGLGTDDCGD